MNLLNSIVATATPYAITSTDLPAFPTFDLGQIGKWFMDGAMNIVTSNMVWFILPGLAIAGYFGAIALMKRSGRKVVKG